MSRPIFNNCQLCPVSLTTLVKVKLLFGFESWSVLFCTSGANFHSIASYKNNDVLDVFKSEKKRKEFPWSCLYSFSVLKLCAFGGFPLSFIYTVYRGRYTSFILCLLFSKAQADFANIGSVFRNPNPV